MSKFIPNAFQIPNSVIDELLAKLTCAELKCYLFVVRKTKGWNKESDSISVSQFMEVTGLSNRSVITACESLVEMGLLERSGGERKLNTYSVKAFDFSETSEKSSSVKSGENFSETSEKSSSVKSGENFSETSEKSSSNLVKKVHTQNNNKNTIQNTNTNLTVSNAHARKTSKSAVEILEQFGITGQLAKDFIAHRKVKKSVITETVLNGFQREADKAGIPLVEAITISIERNWQGFRASWNWQDGQQQARKESFAEKNSSDWSSPEKMARAF